MKTLINNVISNNNLKQFNKVRIISINSKIDRAISKMKPNHMGDEILSIYTKTKVLPNHSLDAGFILLSFRADIEGLQSGMDWLVSKGFIVKDKLIEGNYTLTKSGYAVKKLED